MKIAVSADFFSALAKLPKTPQNKTIKLVAKFQSNPTSLGLNYEKISTPQSDFIYSIRVDLSYRCIVLKPERGDVYILLWVDNHDNAYDWAQRHKCSINAETGSIQIVETKHVTEQISVAPEDNTETLFGSFRDRELMRLGVPEDILQLVKQINNENDLDQLHDNLPEEAYEGLFYIIAGDSYESVLEYLATESVDDNIDTTDYEKALDNINSKRRFYVVDEDDEDNIDFISMLNAPLEKWRVFLHPTQRKLINRDWNGPVRVLGGAGTGKTVVAMHRAKWLAKKLKGTDGKILFTTFTKNLATDIHENLKTICDENILSHIEVINLDRWVYEFLYKSGYKEEIVYSGKTQDIWSNALSIKPTSLDLPDSFFPEEWERIIQPQNVNSQLDYIKATRLGRGTRLNRSQRKGAWEVFDEYRSLLSKEGYKEPSDAMRDVGILLSTGRETKQYSHIIIDEAQDFSVQAFKLLRALVPEGKNDMFIVGDAHQRIYGHKIILSHCGIKIVGRAKKLKLNYRTTDEIRKWAVNLFRNNEIDDLDNGIDTQSDYKSLYHGPEPELKRFDDYDAEMKYIVQSINKLISEHESEKICVVVRTNKLVEEYKNHLTAKNIKAVVLSRNKKNNMADDNVCIATMHRVKGLSFDHVIIASVNEGVLPLESYSKSAENLILDETLLQEKALLFVAATRAKKTLLITSYGVASSFI